MKRRRRAMHEFTVWAPRPKKVAVKIGEELYPMNEPDDKGWWRAQVEGAGPGTDYAFVLDDDPTVYPDPRSRWQPHGVHGASRIDADDVFAWSDGSWQVPPLAGAGIY